jgi:arsenate reductase
VTLMTPPGGGTGADSPARIRVLFVSSGNAARSQMAEAILRQEAGDRFEVASGGTNARAIEGLTEEVMREAGFDLGDARSKSVTTFLGRKFDYVITLCDRARVECPIFPGGAQTLHWGLDDPSEAEAGQQPAAFRRALTEVSGRIRAFIPLATLAASR